MPGPPGAFDEPASSQTDATLKTAAWAANSQKTSRQWPASTTTPPNSGPSTVAMPQMKVTEAKTRARWRSGNSMAMATMANPEIQPLPRPWTRRPARKVKTSGAAALITQPTTMTTPAKAVAERRPKISDRRPELAPARIAPTKKPAVAHEK